MELTSRQKTRRNQVQSLIDEGRPVATWIAEHMVQAEIDAFDAAHAESEAAATVVIGDVLTRLGHQLGGKYSAPAPTTAVVDDEADEDEPDDVDTQLNDEEG